jgi:light-regulated signal transduction histidine kinase (bacteriophytochrome)
MSRVRAWLPAPMLSLSLLVIWLLLARSIGLGQLLIGLGLALTKRIVEAQGGSVGVESVVGRGSTFSAVLPRVVRVVRVESAA